MNIFDLINVCHVAIRDDDWRTPRFDNVANFGGLPFLPGPGGIEQLCERPWVPPQQPGFGPWMECDSDTPIPCGVRCCILLKDERAERKYLHRPWDEDDVVPLGELDTFPEHHVAYCVPLGAETLVACATQATDWRDWNDGDTDIENRPMFDADELGLVTGKWERHNARETWQKPTEAPRFMTGEFKGEVAGVLTVAPFDHKPGRWGCA